MINQMRSRSIRSNLSQNKDEKESEKYVEKAWRERIEKEQSERKSGERECVVVQRYVRIEKLKKDGNRERKKNSFPTGSRNIFVQINGKASSKHWHNIKFTSLLQQLYLFFFWQRGFYKQATIWISFPSVRFSLEGNQVKSVNWKRLTKLIRIYLLIQDIEKHISSYQNV